MLLLLTSRLISSPPFPFIWVLSDESDLKNVKYFSQHSIHRHGASNKFCCCDFLKKSFEQASKHNIVNDFSMFAVAQLRRMGYLILFTKLIQGPVSCEV